MTTSYDAVVIGGGHNGLAAAIHLARKGMSVALVERNARLGGAIATEEITLPGFRHDLYAMNLSLFAGSPFAQTYGKELGAHGLDCVPATDCFASPFGDRWLGVSTDAEATAARIAAFSEADAARWREMTAAFGEDAPHYFGILGAPMRLRSLGALLYRTLRAKGRTWTFDAIRLLLSSPRDFLDANFTSPEVKALLAPWGMHLDFPPDASGGAMFPFLEAMADQAFGMALGKGGADVVPKAMAGLFAASGGEVRTGTAVTGIDVVGGRATGVRLASGETLGAREAVLASVTPSALLSLIGGSTGKTSTDRALAGFRHGPGTMMIHIACDALPDWRAGEALQKFAYVHLAPTMAGLSTTYADAMEGRLPAEPGIVVGQPTAVDPSRAPAGKHILWVQVRVVPSVVTGDTRGEIAPGPWSGIKEAMADRVMALIEREAPGFGAHVLARTVHSPDDLEAANPNLVGGDSIGGSHHLRQNFFFRPAVGMADHTSPVKGLHMIGSSTWPGAGVGAGSGFLGAKRITGR
ncbi:NAD(P)/FAD-dependent oxidoreductase [Acuticoccus sp. MNP-M23]|uniref:phytoene desaturase family protein n=1 Tax=Acuticoccus sp. MNP-M23 TaxID=3072793 RepID=UPI002815DFA8|nr:NAD(P)/FAD-dependent oxidoreductase [Acuticoccus sp. MNP-M23]WMS42478.1 NAD(P)/FAD-dependent oxidoreductase [Acuticoccus sp. MNP-M23]